MTRFAFLALALVASTVSALPLEKRIAQVIVESTAQWEQACVRTDFVRCTRCHAHRLLTASRWWWPSLQPTFYRVL